MDLRKINLFKNLSDEDLNLLKKKTLIEEVTFSKGDHIFRLGDKSNDFYYLIRGHVSVYQIDSNGKRFIFQSINKSVVFGEVYAYLNIPFDFSAKAEEDSKVLIIRDFRKLFIEPTPRAFLTNFIDVIANKTMKLSKRNQITSQVSLRQKIAKFLLENEKDNLVNLKMTREDLADYLSTTRPSVSRELSSMVDDGLIKIQGRKIGLIDKKSLKNIL
ncbi:MAG: Crp/Fnr family transcriptional regulator [Anaerococcus sp.]|nr:Crp/Fnr family transcriptional regulator [Anaerococcus sp.]